MTQQIICADKRESIRTHTMGIYHLGKSWKRAGKITPQEYAKLLIHVRKLDQCCALAARVADLESSNHEDDVEGFNKEMKYAPESQSCHNCGANKDKDNRGAYCYAHREFLHMLPGDRIKPWCRTLPNNWIPETNGQKRKFIRRSEATNT
jgi:hypothetical protein